MSNGNPRPILLCGPSGSGKTSLGEFLKCRGCLHLDADLQPPNNGYELLGIKPLFESFINGRNPYPLAQELEWRRQAWMAARVIVTLPSFAFPVQAIEPAEGIMLFRFLDGPGWACKRSFLNREMNRDSSQNPAWVEAHWDRHNREIVDALSTPAYAAYKIEALNSDGAYLPKELVAQRLLELSEPVGP
jgi:hypothetical protein